jgi:hydrogenase nickel incorporation protein HypB
MCGTCGCGSGAVVTLLADRPVPAWMGGHGLAFADHPYRHARIHHLHALEDPHHDHDHPGHDHHDHDHDHHGHEHVDVLASAETTRTVELQQKVLAKNDDLAQRNREWLHERGILAINLMSSPGSGKTTLLERTTKDLRGKMTISVIEGDQETALDARRIQAAGSRVIQINTGVGCHLDAEMVAQGLRGLDPPSGSIVVIENVGNLVCPALFDLGEEARVVLASVTEGADKPLKYPHMFRQADLVLLNKTDLLPYVEFDVKRYMADLRMAAPDALLLQVSATTGDGIQGWYDWLRRRIPPPHD